MCIRDSLYPEGEEDTDAQNSVAGQILRVLSVKDSEWLASVYDLSNRKPVEAAAKLGLPAESVRGRYNPLDEMQKVDDPDSWELSEWSHIDMVFTDENGNRIMADSNKMCIRDRNGAGQALCGSRKL